MFYRTLLIILENNYDRVKYPLLDALYPDCRNGNDDDFDYNQEIDSWSDVLSLKIKQPLFIIENEKGHLKYFKNFKMDKDDNRYKGLKVYRNQQHSRDCIYLIQELTFKNRNKEKNRNRGNNIRLRPGQNYFGVSEIYLIDLMLNDTDSLTRLHYVNTKDIISSNWIKLK